MKNNLKPTDMKKFIILMVATLTFSSSFQAAAGGYRGGIGTGISFGYTHSAYRTLDWATDELVEKNGLGGLYVGITHDKELIRNAMFLETGLYYTYLNEARRESLSPLPHKLIGDRSEHYLNVPLRVKYNFPVAHWLDIFAYGGPTFVAGLSSTLTYRTRLSDDKTAAIEYNYYSGKIQDRNIDELIAGWFGGMLPETCYRRFDMFLGGALGAEFLDALEVSIGYDWGLVNRNRGTFADDFKTNRHQFYINLGVRF